MLSKLEIFLLRFNQLKREANDSPKTLEWVAKENSKFRELVCEVHALASWIDRYLAEKESKYTVAPAVFVQLWEEYKRDYAKVVEAVAEAEMAKMIEQFISRLKQRAVDRGLDPEKAYNDFLSKIEADADEGDSFDPSKDNPVSLIMNILGSHDDLVSAGIFDDETGDKAIGAWKFFEQTIGVNFREIYRRWKESPELFIPSHAAQGNLLPLYELYNEAVRSYVFGNKVAAIAMCRALLEHVLVEYYKVDGKDLESVISIAEGRYKHFKKLRLQQKRRLANNILHNYREKPDVDDQVVIEFLGIIKQLVQDIPHNVL